MKEEIFNQLIESVKEAKLILKGEIQPSRTFTIDADYIKELRLFYRMSQLQFAELLGISVKTLQNWEQKRRLPHGPAQKLLQIAAAHPEIFFNTFIEPKIKKEKRRIKKTLAA